MYTHIKYVKFIKNLMNLIVIDHLSYACLGDCQKIQGCLQKSDDILDKNIVFYGFIRREKI